MDNYVKSIRIASFYSRVLERESCTSPRLLEPLTDAELARMERLRIPDRFSQFAVHAAMEAQIRAPEVERLACIFSTTFNTRASVEGWLASLVERPNPLLFPSATSAVTVGHIARAAGVHRSVVVLNSVSPLPTAMRWLGTGRERAVLVVCTEELLKSAPAMLARCEPRTRFAEATAAAILVADTPSNAGLPSLAGLSTVATFVDADIAHASSTSALKHLPNGQSEAQTVAHGLCSTSQGHDPDPVPRGNWSHIIKPRLEVGDTLGASSLVALGAVLEAGAKQNAPRSWLVHDIDRGGGALSFWINPP
jgi:hypothetical protein